MRKEKVSEERAHGPGRPSPNHRERDVVAVSGCESQALVTPACCCTHWSPSNQSPLLSSQLNILFEFILKYSLARREGGATVLVCDGRGSKGRDRGVKRHHGGGERARQSGWQAANVDATVLRFRSADINYSPVIHND